jgi:hypothetical protein
MDWLIREHAPIWLCAGGLHAAAGRLQALAPVLEVSVLDPALEALTVARKEAGAAWSAALGAPPALARAPWLAGRATARETAWGSGAAAAWAAARLGVGDMAGDRARALTREIAGDTAATIGRDAGAGCGRAAAREAARAALAPTLEQLRISSFALLDRMLPTVQLEITSHAHATPLLVE